MKIGSISYSAKHRTYRGAQKTAGLGLAVLLPLALAVVVTTGADPAIAAVPPAQCLNTIYTSDNTSGDVRPVTLSGSVGTAFYHGTPTAGTINQLGISKGGVTGYDTDTAPTPGVIVKYDSSTPTGTITADPKPVIATNPPNGVAGAFDPKDGNFYYGGYNAAGNLVISSYSPTSGTTISPLATVTVPASPGTNGDLAFSADGHLYFVAASATVTSLYVLDALLPTAASGATFTARQLTSTTGLTAASNGIAFASDGYLYLGRATTLSKVNPITGATVGADIPLTAASGPAVSSTDLGSCAGPNSEAISTTVDNRVNPGDQFSVTLTGGDYSAAHPFGTGTTTGTDTGPQTNAGEVAGPGILLPGQTYTETITPAGTTNAANYDFSYRCTDQDGNLTRNGGGASTTVTPTAGTGVAESCTFFAAPKAAATISVTPSPLNYDHVGQVVNFALTVTNTGPSTLTLIDLDDEDSNGNFTTPTNCAPSLSADLAPGGVIHCSVSYTVTQADLVKGYISNSAILNVANNSGETASTFGNALATSSAQGVTAKNDSAQTTYNHSTTVDVLSNDTAGTSPIDTSSVVLTGGTNGGKNLTTTDGSWAVTAGGSILFTPAAGSTGNAGPITYTVSDANGLSSSATLSVNVAAGPAAGADSPAAPLQGGKVAFSPLDNDTPSQTAGGGAGSFDYNSFTFSTAGLPTGSALSNGGQTVTVKGEGTYVYDSSTQVVTFTPLNSFTGATTPVTYSITDQAGNTASAAISTSVTAVTPQAVNDQAKTASGNSVTVHVLDNDLPGDPSVPFDPTTVTFPGHGNTYTNADGVYTAQNNGTVLFTPSAGASGTLAPVTYSVQDTNGTATSATLTVKVGNVPVANNDSASTPQNTAVSTSVLDNDTPGDQGNPCTSANTPPGCDTGTFDKSSLAFTATGQDTGATVAPDGKTLTVSNEGVFKISAAGVVTFTPEAYFTGPAPAVRYSVTDSFGNVAGARLLVQVRAITPTATDDTATGTFNSPVALAGATNDTPGTDDNGTPNDPTDDVTPAINVGATVFPTAGQPGASTISDSGKTLTVTDQGVWVVKADGSLLFTPYDTFSGVASPVTYQITDANGTTATGTAQATVQPGPVANADLGHTDQGSATTFNVLDNDVPGQNADGTAGTFVDGSFTFSTDGQPAGAVLASRTHLTVPDVGDYTYSNGSVTFTPDPHFSGTTPAVTYSITDNSGNTASGTFSVAVAAVTPVVTDDSANTAYRTPVVLAGSSNDLPGDANSTIDNTATKMLLTGQDPSATLSADGKTLTVPGVGTWAVNADGTITFTPGPGYNATATAVYQVTDSNGSTARGNLSVDVADGPTTTADTVTIDQGVTTSVNVLSNDTPGDNADGTPGTFDTTSVVFPAAGQPTNAEISLGGRQLLIPGEGTYIINADTGVVTFNPDPTFTGPGSVIRYQVTDSLGTTAESYLIVTAVAVTPTAVNDFAATAGGTPVSLEGSTNDTPGAASAPIDNSATVLLASGQPTGTVLSLDGKTLTVPAVGVWKVNADGTITFTPVTGFSGDATADYQVADSNGTTNQGVESVTVQNGPIAQDDTNATDQGVAVSTPVLANDTPGVNADGTAGTFQVSSLSLLTSGLPTTATLSTDGKTLTVLGEGVYTVDNANIVFTPEATFVGTATPVNYTVQDENGEATGAKLTVTVAGVNPVATNDAGTTPYSTAATLPGETNDTGGNTGAPLVPAATVFTAANQPANSVLATDGKTLTVPNEGVWTVNATGTVTFTPAAGFSGVAGVVTYQISDTNGTTATATLSVTVGAPPKALPDHATTKPGTAVTFGLLGNDTPGTDGAGNSGTFDASSTIFTAAGQPTGAVVSTDGKTVRVPGQGLYSLSTDGTVTFTPVKNFAGNTSALTYQVTDSFGNVATSTLTVTVLKPGSALALSRTTRENTGLTVQLSTQVTPSQGEKIVAGSYCLIPSTLQVNGKHPASAASTKCVHSLTVKGVGTWKVAPNGSVRFTPLAGFVGVTALRYQATDTGGATFGNVLTIHVPKSSTGGGNTGGGATGGAGNGGGSTGSGAGSGSGNGPTNSSGPVGHGKSLPNTGVNVVGLGGIAALLLLAGLGALVLGRRRLNK